MEREFHTIMVVLTADRECFERVRRLSQSRNHGWLWWLATDPDDLLAALYPTTAPQPEPAAFHLAGVVLDLTAPATPARTPSPDRGTLELAWRLAIMLVHHRNAHHPPVLVVSGEPGIGERLRAAGLDVAAQVAPDADDAAWRHALRLLATAEAPAPGSAGGPHPHQRAEPSKDAIPVGADLWFEPHQCAVMRDGRSIALTPHEYMVLDRLLQSPGRYVPSRALANQHARPGGPGIEQHSIEQTISGLRRKLGAPAGSSGLLQTRRGIGYGIFPQAPGMRADDQRLAAVSRRPSLDDNNLKKT